MNAIIDLSELHASEFHDSTAFLLRPDNEPGSLETAAPTERSPRRSSEHPPAFTALSSASKGSLISKAPKSRCHRPSSPSSPSPMTR